MKKNKETEINIISQRILVILSFSAFIYGIYFSFVEESLYLLAISFLIGKFIVGVLATQIALHRYFSHNSFKTSKSKHTFLCWASILSGQGSPVGWSAHHRHHHVNADTALDTHSPKESKWLAAGFWLMKSYDYYLNVKKLRRVPTDLLRDPTVKFIDQYYYKVWLAILLVSLLINWKITIFFILSPLAWGYINAAFITLLSHIKLPGSYRNFETNDHSYNNKFIQLYMLGEALHNNHHNSPNKYKESVLPGEFDFVGWVIEKFLVRN